ncbi:hypothetical protein A3K73_02120 [Candidatus Pacearchaeota archaeon RBG_13_36_9]|nr:MAG: hypothetical protein A3K73_02120 [Candidatus Pacearchaeota archaeon RBG_13_36_9]
MEIKDISSKGKELFKSEEQEKSWNTSGGLGDLGKDKIESLKQEVSEIEAQIEGRERLSQAVFNEGDKIKMEINNFLREITVPGLDAARDKITLKQKQIEIAELQLKEKINCWQDVAKLKEELRASKKELTERQSRLEMLGKILEE